MKKYNALFDQFAKGKITEKDSGSNCVIYTRVSTKEQADNNMSLPTQRKACENYASKQDFTIMGYFGGTYESAKTDERKEFNNMLSFVKKSREKISYIIVYSVDRFSRSGANAIYIADQLKKEGISIVSVTQPTDASTASGRLQQNIQFIFSEYDNQQRREKCMAGVKEALLRGEWCHKPPVGYDSIRENGKRKIVVNQKGKLLRKAFLWKAEQNLSNESIKIKLAHLGLKVSHQFISSLFRNTFYCGIISHNSLEGKLIEGNHEKLISMEVFLKVNNLLNANPHGYKHNEENDDLPLKRFYRCDYCGSNMRGYIVQKKQIYYYKCNKKGCGNNKNAEQLHDKFLTILEYFNIGKDEEIRELLMQKMIFEYQKQTKGKEEDISNHEKHLEELEYKLDKLEEKYILEEISAEMHKKFKTKFIKEKAEIEDILLKSGKGVSNLENCVEIILNASENLNNFWCSADYSSKQRVQYTLFPKGIMYNKKTDGCRTEEIEPVFAYIAYQMQVLGGKRKGIPELNLKYAGLVEDIGVEPMTSCMPCKRSSQLS